MKDKAYLFGPFIGEASWEFYRFAPFAIYLKKKHPDIKLIVLTRPSRFDLYGSYADLLINLDIEDDIFEDQKCFKSNSISINRYYKTANMFKRKYQRLYTIEGHFYPDIKQYRYKLKWQFTRTMMDYDFKPRKTNEKFIGKYTRSILVDLSWVEDDDFKNYLINEVNKNVSLYINYEDIMNNNTYNENVSLYGTSILLLKKMQLVIGNIKNSDITKLALLLKIPVITINEELNEESVSLLNPFKTKITHYTYGENN